MKPSQIITVLCFYLAPIVSACNAHELKLITETFPPYNFMANNNVVGINTDLISAACQRAKIECTFRLRPWERAMREAKSAPNRGVYSTSRTAAREVSFIWVGPIASSNACFYRLKSRNDIVLASNRDLKQYTVGISRGDIYESILKKNGLVENEHYLTYSHKHQDMKMFKQGNFDLMIGSSITLASQLNSVNLTPEDVVPVMEVNDDSLVGNFLALNKNTRPEVAQALQTKLDELKKEKYIESLVTQYVGSQSHQTAQLPAALTRCLDGAVNY